MYSFMCIPQLHLSIFSSQNYLPETLKIALLIIKERNIIYFVFECIHPLEKQEEL